MRIVSLTKEAKDNILEDLLKRSPNNYDQYQETVNEILNEVKTKGDEAVFAYTEKFDHAKLTADTLYVTEDEIKEAYEKVDEELIEVMKKSIANIRAFHEKQVKNSWFTTREDGVIDPGTACDCLRQCRRLCAGRKSSLSIQCTDEYHTGSCSRCAPHRNGNTAGSRRKGKSGYSGGSKSCRSHGSMQSRRSTGDCSPGLRNRVYSESRQDRSQVPEISLWHWRKKQCMVM